MTIPAAIKSTFWLFDVKGNELYEFLKEYEQRRLHKREEYINSIAPFHLIMWDFGVLLVIGILFFISGLGVFLLPFFVLGLPFILMSPFVGSIVAMTKPHIKASFILLRSEVVIDILTLTPFPTTQSICASFNAFLWTIHQQFLWAFSRRLKWIVPNLIIWLSIFLIACLRQDLGYLPVPNLYMNVTAVSIMTLAVAFLGGFFIQVFIALDLLNLPASLLREGISHKGHLIRWNHGVLPFVLVLPCILAPFMRLSTSLWNEDFLTSLLISIAQMIFLFSLAAILLLYLVKYRLLNIRKG